MSDFLQLLATFHPPQPLLDYLNGHKKMSAEAQRWLSVWPHWDAWLVELEQRATEDDRRLLEELRAIMDGVAVREVSK